MSKDHAKRLTDTIAFIRNTANVRRNGAYRGDAADLCNQWKLKASAELQQQVSEFMSQGWTTEGEATRAYRRAIYLLERVGDSFAWDNFSAQKGKDLTNSAGRAADARKVRGGDFAATLDDTIEITLGAAHQGFINSKFHEFKATPLKFLESNRLKISGKDGGNQTYYFSMYMDNARITYALQKDKRGDSKVCVPVEVINVPATSFSDTKGKKNGLKGLDQIGGTLVSASGSRVVMTTTQFTGCSFCIQKSGANIVAAHMDPEGVTKSTGLTGPGIRTELMQGFGFDNTGIPGGLEGAASLYGCKEVGDSGWGYDQSRAYMTIVGICDGNGWQVFTQFNAVDGGFNARQIFPTPG